MTPAHMEEQESIGYWLEGEDDRIVETVANRYIGANPAIAFCFRRFHASGILQREDGLYDMELTSRFPQAESDQRAFVMGLVWGDAERSIDLIVSCYGPIRMYLNGSLLYRSNVIDEIKPDALVRVGVTFAKGWNWILVEAKKTTAGFGCLLGAEEAKVRILNVLAPFTDRRGQAGWCFALEPYADSGSAVGEGLPDPFAPEALSRLEWLPRTGWTEDEAGLLNTQRLFGLRPGQAAYAWAKLRGIEGGNGEPLVLEGEAAGATRIWLDRTELLNLSSGSPFQLELPPFDGERSLLIRTDCGGDGWGFQLSESRTERAWELRSPHPIRGHGDPWLYLGPVDSQLDYGPDDLQAINRLYDTAEDVAEDKTYWRLDAPDARVRPYYENALLSSKWTTSGVTNYARWDYPLGVTMYGLLRAGRELNLSHLTGYAIGHIRACTDYYEYAKWDCLEYGFPSVNHQLVLMRMLDNCGSFGSAMLEAYGDCPNPGFLAVAEAIRDFIGKRLERKEDGVFFRECKGEYAENTLWADDLYMSTPFLIRYFRITGDAKALDEAAKQFLLFKRYLFLPDWRLMSHVYDFKYGMPTRVPWGRGNGWCLFSLSELLEVLPEDHPCREPLIEFFNEMCTGVAELQTAGGLWRQVLNDPEAYEETSCTAMFTYAFARGVRFGWLSKPERYAEQAQLAWRALTSKAIDRHGNVYGVCSGSRYSFSPDYYKYDLLTVTNDNHGIGIMLLAGIEIGMLKKSI